MKYNRKAVRLLIRDAFSDDELTMFCSEDEDFREAAQSFSSEMSLNKKAFVLVEYCHRRKKLPELLEKIRAENPERYEEYQDQLESSESVSSVLDEVRAGESEVEAILEAMSPTESPRKSILPESRAAGENGHPLSGDPLTVKQWFLRELSPDEQTFVMTAALFSGLERQELMQIYEDVLSILRPPEVQSEGEA